MLKPIKGHPGKFLEVGSGKVISISEYREGDKYDTICIYGVNKIVMTAGTEYIFFRDIERKRMIDTNFTQPVRLSAGEQMIIDRVGLHVRNAVGVWALVETDFPQVVENAFLRVEVNKLLLTEGIATTFASGYGLSFNGATGNPGSMNIGVPSQAAAGKLLRTQTMTDKHEVIGYFSFLSRDWANWPGGALAPDPKSVGMPEIEQSFTFVTCFLHGLIKTAVNT